jgi:hypothetical protein
MVSVYTFSKGIEDERRREIIYNGGIILFKRLEGLVALTERVQLFAREIFSPHDPLSAHDVLDRAAYLEHVERFQRAMTNSADVKNSFADVLSALGVDNDATGYSRFAFRIQPPATSHIDRNTATLGPHRDSWYSQDYAQTNWWTPWYPLDVGRALRIHIKYWKSPLPNSSQGWNLNEFRQARSEVNARNGSFEELKSAYPPVEPLAPLDSGDAMEFVMEPGDILNFSLAHLHEGPPNITNVARFSTDFRTISAEDVVGRDLAPNIDSQSTGSAIKDFNRLSDDFALTDMVSALGGNVRSDTVNSSD